MKKRPLISKSDMKKIVSAAKRKRFDGKTVQVQALLREHYPNRSITGQMRRLVAAALDSAGVQRKRRPDWEERAWNNEQKKSIPGVLGGLTDEQVSQLGGEPIDVRYSPAAEQELDEFLAEEAEKGNRRAMRLLKALVVRG
ncbi:hypothetical protein GC170_14605 [bacterium]|nr:hypothetical protein [bacterium]